MFDFATIFLYHRNMIVNEHFLEMYVLMCRTITKPDRLKIIEAIGENKLNVTALQKQLNISMSNLSNHLNDLYRAGILAREKQGNFVFYYLVEPKLIDAVVQMQEIFKSISSRRDSTRFNTSA